MKKQIYSLIAVLVLGSFTVNAQSLKQTNTTRSNDGIKVEGFENKKVVKAVQKVDLDTYTTVNNLYQTEGVAFFNLSSSQKEAFKVASTNMITKLANSRKARNKNAAKQIAANKAIFEIIWTSQNVSNVELVEVPESTESYTSL